MEVSPFREFNRTLVGYLREEYVLIARYLIADQKYGKLEQGSFGNYVIRHEDFVHPVPEEIESKYGGPPQCTGVSYPPCSSSN